MVQRSFFFHNRSKFIPVGYYFQDSLVTDINHLISAATVNNWAPETLFSIFSAESSLQPLGSPLGAQGDGAVASGLFIYYLFHLLQGSEQIGIGKKKWRESLWNDNVQGSHDYQKLGRADREKRTRETQNAISFQIRTPKKKYL